MPQKQSKYTLMLLGIITVGVLVLIIGLIGVRQQRLATAKLQQEYKDKKDQFDDHEKKMQNAENDRKTLAMLEQRLATLDDNLIDYMYVPTYLRQMQATAINTGNIINTIQPGEIKPIEKMPLPVASDGTASAPAAQWKHYQVQSINLQMQGNYVSLIRLLDEFRKFPKMIYVRTIDLTPNNANGSEGVSVRLQTYAIVTPNQYRIIDTAKSPAESGGASQ